MLLEGGGGAGEQTAALEDKLVHETNGMRAVDQITELAIDFGMILSIYCQRYAEVELITIKETKQKTRVKLKAIVSGPKLVDRCMFVLQSK